MVQHKHRMYPPPPGPPPPAGWVPQPQASASSSGGSSSYRAPAPPAKDNLTALAADDMSISVYDEFEPTAGEKKLAKQLLLVTQSIPTPESSTDDAILLGDRAVPIFETSGLSQYVLGEIWNACDEHRGGFLTFNGVCLALRLMGRAQDEQDSGVTHGEADGVKMGWFRPGKVPYLDALSDTPRPQPLARPHVIPSPAANLPSLLEASPPPSPKRSGFLGRFSRPLQPDHRRVVSTSSAGPSSPSRETTRPRSAERRADDPDHDYLVPSELGEQPAFLVRTASQRQGPSSLARSPSTAGVYRRPLCPLQAQRRHSHLRPPAAAGARSSHHRPRHCPCPRALITRPPSRSRPPRRNDSLRSTFPHPHRGTIHLQTHIRRCLS
ncbi:hypothetical protein EXIGLDRAFT_268305 [Exidia glandulosa HHB12029]|uniref:EH domain-containing protein n=1 Tax=Exidia glandulosa HHB12029 TaxID=1314781 RepID=A0A165DPH5_EXIGL|nr:hypothetical protein EXIGLDRAFT_268305 [Exidia glandulosa HHB12029]